MWRRHNLCCSYNLLNGLFCGIGNSKTPQIFVAVATVVNVILDYTLIDILQMGAIGTTKAAKVVSVLFTLMIIKRKLPFKVFKEDLKPNFKLSLEMNA